MFGAVFFFSVKNEWIYRWFHTNIIMNDSSSDFESQIDAFLEHVKRGDARGMEDRGNDGWLSNENLVHSIIKRSRSGMSSSDDGTIQTSGMLELFFFFTPLSPLPSPNRFSNEIFFFFFWIFFSLDFVSLFHGHFANADAFCLPLPLPLTLLSPYPACIRQTPLKFPSNINTLANY